MVVDYFRPIYIAIIIVLLLLLLFSIFYKWKYRLIIGITMSIVSLFSIMISAYYLAEIGIIADEKNMGGDPVSFNMFLLIVGLSILNPVIFMKRNTSFSNDNKVE